MLRGKESIEKSVFERINFYKIIESSVDSVAVG